MLILIQNKAPEGLARKRYVLKVTDLLYLQVAGPCPDSVHIQIGLLRTERHHCIFLVTIIVLSELVGV